jgi:hypothetical protein
MGREKIGKSLVLIERAWLIAQIEIEIALGSFRTRPRNLMLLMKRELNF